MRLLRAFPAVYFAAFTSAPAFANPVDILAPHHHGVSQALIDAGAIVLRGANDDARVKEDLARSVDQAILDTADDWPIVVADGASAPGLPPAIGSLAAFQFPGGGGYTPPTLTSNYAVALGDSRTGNAGGWGLVFPQAGATIGYNNGFAGWVMPLSGGYIVSEDSFNYGVGAQDSAGEAGRLNSTGTDCNSSADTLLSCFTGTKGTNTGSISANATSFTLAVTSGATPGANDYINFAAGALWSCQAQGISGTGPYTVTIPSSCVTSTIANGTLVALSHPANSSAFASYLSVSGVAAQTDVDNNKSGTGQYSVVSDPAQVVFFIGNVNDGNLPSLTSIANDVAIFNALGPSGANKIVIAGDEIPRGLAEGWSIPANTYDGAPEVATIPAPSGPYTYTVHNAAGIYYDTQQVFFAPAGTGTVPFVAGASDGTQLINCTTLTTAAANGTGTCVPTAGQYSVDSTTGIFTFNSADASKKVAIFYRWKNLGGASIAYLTTIHNWFDSTYCGTGTDPATGLAVKGASCPGLYPWVHVASTWAAAVDGTTGANYYPLPYVSADGLHPLPYGGAAVAKALVTTAQSAGAIKGTTPFPQPTVKNFIFNAQISNSTANATTTCPAPLASNYFLYNPNISESILTVGTPLYFPSATSGIPQGATITCIDVTHHYIQISNSATAITSFTGIIALADPTSYVGAGVMDYTNQTSATAISNTGTPSLGTLVTKKQAAGWTTQPDAATATALAAGTMGFSYGIESNPFNDGFDDFVIVLQGYGVSGSITLSQNSLLGIQSLFATGDMHRAQCDIKVSAGPNGHLTGLGGMLVKVTDTSTGTFLPPGATSGAYTGWYGGQGASSMQFSDQSIATGAPNVTSQTLYNAGVAGASINVLDLPELGPPAKFGGTGTLSQTTAIVINYGGGDPVSAVVRIRRCWQGKVTQ
jgi:hypothetical protein